MHTVLSVQRFFPFLSLENSYSSFGFWLKYHPHHPHPDDILVALSTISPPCKVQKDRAISILLFIWKRLYKYFQNGLKFSGQWDSIFKKMLKIWLLCHIINWTEGLMNHKRESQNASHLEMVTKFNCILTIWRVRSKNLWIKRAYKRHKKEEKRKRIGLVFY